MAWAAFEEPEFEPNYPLSWTLGEYVGAGSYGKVYKCHIGYNHILAVKKVQLEPQTRKEVEALNNEIRILKKFRHERIVSYYGNEQKDDQLHLFMEFMAGGSLSGQIKSYGVLPEHLSKRYTKQMLEGVYFLHSQDIIHRDIKGSNVLLDSQGNVKLADFGLSKVIEKFGSKTNLATSCGSPYWMAPEILWGYGYGRKADIWSLGCTVVEMLTGKPPLGHLEPHSAMFNTGIKPLDLTLPESVSNEAKSFIEAALTWKPDNRPWSHELQGYAFILDRCWCTDVMNNFAQTLVEVNGNMPSMMRPSNMVGQQRAMAPMSPMEMMRAQMPRNMGDMYPGGMMGHMSQIESAAPPGMYTGMRPPAGPSAGRGTTSGYPYYQ